MTAATPQIEPDRVGNHAGQKGHTEGKPRVQLSAPRQSPRRQQPRHRRQRQADLLQKDDEKQNRAPVALQKAGDFVHRPPPFRPSRPVEIKHSISSHLPLRKQTRDNFSSANPKSVFCSLFLIVKRFWLERAKIQTSGEACNTPAGAILAAKILVGIGYVVELEIRRVPMESGLRETAGHASQQDRFGQGTGVVETSRGLALAEAGINKLPPVVLLMDLRAMIAGEVLVRVKPRESDV